MRATSEAVRRCAVFSCSRRRDQPLVGPNESSTSTGALASRASPCTGPPTAASRASSAALPTPDTATRRCAARVWRTSCAPARSARRRARCGPRKCRPLGAHAHSSIGTIPTAASRASSATPDAPVMRCAACVWRRSCGAATRAASVRAQHGVQKVGEASTTPWRAAPTERGPTERGPTWTASSGRLSRGRGRAVAADCRRPSRRASDMPPARGREEGADCGSGSVALVVLSRRVCVGTFISLPRTRVERVAGNALLRALRRQSAEGPSAAGRVGPASIGPDLERAGPSPAVGTYTATRSYPLVNSLR